MTRHRAPRFTVALTAALLAVSLLGCPSTKPAPAEGAADAGGGATADQPDANPPRQSTSILKGFPYERLDLEGHPMHTFVVDVDEASKKRFIDAGAREWNFFRSESPHLRHFVFKIADAERLPRAEKELEAWVTEGQHAYNVDSARSGGWLLVTGFASAKPVSPEMKAAQDKFLAAFAGGE